MKFTIIREAAAKAYIEERVPSKLIASIDELAITLDFIYDFIDKGDYESEIDLYKYIADLLDNTDFLESEIISEAIDRIIILTNMHNRSDITIYELIKGFNDIFSTNIIKVGEKSEISENFVERDIKLKKPVDRFYNNMSDILGISRENLINNILTSSMSNILSASSDAMKGILPFEATDEEKEEKINSKKDEIESLKEKNKR